jgi:hypothetical protein
VFLRLSGVEPRPDGAKREASTLALAVATGEIDREQTTGRLRELAPEQS